MAPSNRQLAWTRGGDAARFYRTRRDERPIHAPAVLRVRPHRRESSDKLEARPFAFAEGGFPMTRIILLVLAALACRPGVAQVNVYGSPTPAPFAGTFDSGGQIPYAGNSSFKLVLHDPNAYGGGLALGFAAT